MTTCVICQETIKPNKYNGWAGGHNAQPLKDGRCCDNCNDLVIEARINNAIYVQATQHLTD